MTTAVLWSHAHVFPMDQCGKIRVKIGQRGGDISKTSEKRSERGSLFRGMAVPAARVNERLVTSALPCLSIPTHEVWFMVKYTDTKAPISEKKDIF